MQLSFASNEDLTVNLATTDEFAPLADRLRDEFTAAGYAVENTYDSTMGEVRSRMLSGTKGDTTVSLSVSRAEDETMVNYQVEINAG